MATIRGAVKCLTCGQAHTLRIGMGQETTHEHKFDCRQCKEPLVTYLDVDYKNISATIRCGENTELIEELNGAPIVNLDANFVIGDEDQGKDMVFPRMLHIHKMLKEAEAAGRLSSIAAPTAKQLNSRPYRRPDYSAEWQHLRKAWSLSRNDKSKLSRREIESASLEFYANDPINDLPDWLWRLAMYMCQPSYEPMLRNAMGCLKAISFDERAKSFVEHYNSEMSEPRATIYMNAMKEFFANYSEFAQVYFFVSRGSEIPPEHKVTSTDFDRVRMSYGNLF